MDETIEEIMRLGEAGSSQPVAVSTDGETGLGSYDVDLASLMTRAQVSRNCWLIFH